MKLDAGGIYVINLNSRPERWKIFIEGVNPWKAAFDKTPERLSAVAGVHLPGYGRPPWFVDRISERRKKSWGGKAGAVLSHRQAIKKAFEQGWDSVLIVEDDAFLTEEMAQKWESGLKRLIEALPDDWSMVNFCTSKPILPCRTVAEYQGVKLVETAGAFGAVAYLLNGRVFRRILKELPDERSVWGWVARYKAIDLWFSRNLVRFGKVYLFAPSVAGHRVGPSDITMTPEAEWKFDFTLKDIQLVRSGLFFAVQKTIRRADNALRHFFSVFRLGIKRLRGL